jgi:Fe-S-cluster containining protein
MGRKGLIPWSEVNSWACKACGRCCVGYRVPLKMDEYARVANLYGHNVVELGLGKIYLRHGPSDRCIFQHPSQGRWVCALQAIKPLACKLFPFRVHSKPVYRRGDRSGYRFRDRTLHIYMDPDCPGIVPGKPGERFLLHTLPEIAEIGMGFRWKQRYTTSKYF